MPDFFNRYVSNYFRSEARVKEFKGENAAGERFVADMFDNTNKKHSHQSESIDGSFLFEGPIISKVHIGSVILSLIGIVATIITWEKSDLHNIISYITFFSIFMALIGTAILKIITLPLVYMLNALTQVEEADIGKKSNFHRKIVKSKNLLQIFLGALLCIIVLLAMIKKSITIDIETLMSAFATVFLLGLVAYIIVQIASWYYDYKNRNGIV